ncbi:hypothetical protein GIB67_035261 [Kingdonia uniflora]|uniref:CAP N-terminal domain-containing protein n=1 Tax=Kingdonia uniflora TaxID=39325 RepID=A0A7J7KXT9_9MAGN|nr:hypothetical protein GIB67_035261 [Kingdonia uniflora]
MSSGIEFYLITWYPMLHKPDLTGLGEFLQPLNEVIVKANVLTEGRCSDLFNHLKSAADSLTALAWIAYSGKDCMSLPIAHFEESWQMAEFYNNKILVEYKNKDPDHVEWAKALKELYVPGLRDYVKSFYPLGPVWSLTGKTNVSAPARASSKAPPPGAPAPPPPPAGSLFSSDSSEAPASRPKAGMAAVFQEISSGETVSAGLRKVTDDMKSKKRTDKTGIVAASRKETRSGSSSFSKTGPPKLELQMGRKWVVENQIGRKNLVIDDWKANNITVDKCTKMVVVFMGEHALPQQFISVFKDVQFLTSPVSHSGA